MISISTSGRYSSARTQARTGGLAGLMMGMPFAGSVIPIREMDNGASGRGPYCGGFFLASDR